MLELLADRYNDDHSTDVLIARDNAKHIIHYTYEQYLERTVVGIYIRASIQSYFSSRVGTLSKTSIANPPLHGRKFRRMQQFQLLPSFFCVSKMEISSFTEVQLMINFVSCCFWPELLLDSLVCFFLPARSCRLTAYSSGNNSQAEAHKR